MTTINPLTSGQTFKDWFNKTNEIINWANVQDGIGVTGISAGTGITLTYANGKNVIGLDTTLPGATFSGNVAIQGNATISGSLSVASLSVNTTTVSYTPKLVGLTSGNIVAVLETGGLTLAKADSADNAEVFGVVIGEDAASTLVAVSGKIDNSSFSDTVKNALGIVGGTLSPGIAYFLSPTVAGGITSIEPTTYGHVSKPIILGITGDTGVILPYRGFIIEGISAGITAELDNKIIISVNYTVDAYALKNGSAPIKPGDPVYYMGENITATDRSNSPFGPFTSADLKLAGGSNNNTTSNIAILRTASILSLRNYCIGAVSSVLSDNGNTVILEVLTRGGNFTVPFDDLDSTIYQKTGITGGIYKLNTTSSLFEPQLITNPTNTSWATILRNNDAENTVRFVLNNTEFDTGGGVSSLLPSSVVIYEGVTGGLTLISSNNLLVNGSFRVWQRGNTSYSGATLSSLGTYFTPLCDRWFASTHGCTSISMSFSRNNFTATQTDVLGSPVHYITYSNTFTTKTTGSLVQRPKLENIIKGARYLNGQTGTISFYAKAGVSGATVDTFYNRYTDSYTSVLGLTTAIESRIIANSPGITLTADWAEYSVTFKLNNGITLSSTEEGWFGIGFEFPNTTTYNLAQVRFNLGNTPVHPLYREFDKELDECKRYYQTSYSYGNLPQTTSDNNLNEASLDLLNLIANTEYSIKLPIKMNAAPKAVQIYSTASGVSGEAYNISAGQDLRNANSGTNIKVPWAITSPYRINAKLSNNIYVNMLKPETFTVVIDGGAYSGDRIKFHWVANADFDRMII